MILHWLINPGLAFNELVLGQRIPKVSLIDKTSSKPKVERSVIPCPHCNTLHDGRTWSGQNGTATKNWFGLYCPSCMEVIPCVMNVFTLLILTLTYPIWGWFKNRIKENWLDKQPERFQNLTFESNLKSFNKKGWIKLGLIWGAFMFVIMTFVFPFMSNETITPKRSLVGLILWTIGGLIFGYTMKLMMNKVPKKAKQI